MSEKRKGYITWDEYFMGVAKLSAMRSKDPSTQVGACIVSEDNKILSMGYNGFPKGCSDDEFPWGKGDPDDYNDKYLYVTHSELNAILNYRGGSQGHHPGRDPDHYLRKRQVCRYPRHPGVQADAKCGGSPVLPVQPHGKKDRVLCVKNFCWRQ